MGTLLVEQVLDRVSAKLLQDAVPEAARRWPVSELVADYNRVKDLIVSFKHDAGLQFAPFTLSAGARQDCPPGTIAFRRLTKNVDGHVITQVDRDDLDHCRPNWQNTSGNEVQHFIPEPLEPLSFWVYPQVEDGLVEMLRVGLFPDVLEEDIGTEVIPFTDDYANPLFDGIMAMAYLKNAMTGDQNMASAHMASMAQFLGLKTNSMRELVKAFSAQEQAKEKA